MGGVVLVAVGENTRKMKVSLTVGVAARVTVGKKLGIAVQVGGVSRAVCVAAAAAVPAMTVWREFGSSVGATGAKSGAQANINM